MKVGASVVSCCGVCACGTHGVCACVCVLFVCVCVFVRTTIVNVCL